MKILYVHGLGGEGGGPLEDALEVALRGTGHELLVLRWGAGRLGDSVVETAWTLAKEAAVERNPFRLAAAVIVELHRRGHRHWDSALANATRATQKLVGIAKCLVRSREAFVPVGFSLGGRILMSALRVMNDPGEPMRRAVFVGAAVAGSHFAHLDARLRTGDRLVNVHSSADQVLACLYPLVHGLPGAAGAAPVRVSGVRNVEVDSGHLSYASLAARLVEVATEGWR